MPALSKLSDRINKVVEYIGFILFALMTVIIAVQVFFRYFLGSSLSWSEEIAIYLFIWIVMIGASSGVKLGFHVSVDFIRKRLPGKLDQVISFIFQLGLLAFALILVFYGYELAQRVTDQLSPAVRLSMFWVYLSVPVSGILMIIHITSHLYEQYISPPLTQRNRKSN